MPSIDPQAESLFAAAAELSGEARKAFLDRECAGQEELRGQLEGLLRAHDRVNHAVDRPAIHQDRLEATCLADAQAVGAVIAGRYKLLEQIGEGGMGTVWVAEQTEPVKRKVALKLIKAGMDSKVVLARFEAERQTLALMDHPNISKVLDGGLTDAGRPYFVMEYVKGVPITEYCDSLKLSVPERLNLFMQVCSAVQHAHQKGIIHRDLKPSNILVAPYDDKPVPKVIDFGLAKALHQRLTERTLHTAHEMVIGTPLYMSPEQAQLNNLDVDTRSDIYSLGVLLYELLTGTTPLEKARFKEAAWDEIRRIIREEEPPRPSTRLSSNGTLPSLAACRRTEPVTLTKQLRGELDWIVMKALEKDRTRRYETATGLAKDVQRYLAGDTVEACPPSLSYRLQKLFRRNRTAVLTAIAFAGVLVVATGVSVTFGIRAGQAARLAQDEATQKQLALLSADKQRERAEQTISQMLEVFDTQISEAAADSLVSQSTITREQRQLYEAAIQYYQLLLEQPETGGAMRSRIAAAALKLGSIYGRIGDEQKAKDALAIALDALTRLIAESPENKAQFYSQLAECHQGLGRLNQSDDIDVSIDHLQKARDLLDALIKSAPANDKPGFQLAKANCLLSLGKALHMKDVADKINPLREFKDAEVVMKQLTEEHPGNHEYLFGLFKAKQNKIIFKGRTGDRSDRAPSLKELIGILKQLLDAPEIDVNQRNRYRGLLAVVLHNLARTYQETSQLVVADQLYCKAIEILEESIADLPGDLHARVYLGRMHVSRGITQAAMGHRDNAVANVEDARRIHQETLGRVGQANPDLSFELAVAEGCLGQLLRDNGNPSGSRTYIEVAIENARKAKVRDPLPMHGMGTELHWLGELAITNDRLNKYDEALKMWEESIRFCEASKQQDAAAFYELGRLATEIQSGAISSDQAVTDAEKLGFPGDPVKSFDQLHEGRQYLVVRFFAIAAKHSPAGGEAQNRYANIAIDRLKALVNQSGSCFVGLTPGNVDFNVLRSHDRFKEFEQSIADKKGVRDSELEETLGLDTTDCPGQ